MEDKIINTEKIKEIAKKSMVDIGGYLKTTGEKVKDVTGRVVEKVKDVTGGVVEKVKDVTGGVVEKVKDVTGGVVEKVKDFTGDVAETLYEIDSEDEKAPPKTIQQSEREEPVKAEEAEKATEPVKERWELYTMDDCIFCIKAKKDLEARVAEDPENRTLKIEKGAENTDPVVIAWLAKHGDGWPKIFLNGKFIGGYSNLEATFKEINNGSI
jgi:glutaredoxin